MSKRLDVLAAVKVLVQAALPGADVKGLDGSAARPTRIPPNGLAIIRSGDPGPPEVDLSPLNYNYEHAIPVEISGYQSSSRTNDEAVDDMASAIGRAVEADRTLGGLCDWLDVEAPSVDDIATEGATVAAGTTLTITASYSTPNPLT
ncbi:MAG: hypothetical protein ACRYG4_20730 [Janthinobacterium lividum]